MAVLEERSEARQAGAHYTRAGLDGGPDEVVVGIVCERELDHTQSKSGKENVVQVTSEPMVAVAFMVR